MVGKASTLSDDNDNTRIAALRQTELLVDELSVSRQYVPVNVDLSKRIRKRRT